MMNEQRSQILLVDDHVENLFALEQLLSKIDAHCMRARNGFEALEKLKEHSFAMMLLDVHMPGLSGYEVVERMRTEGLAPGLPVIFVTAADRDERYEFKAYEQGCIDFIFKPINAYVLLSKVRGFLQLQQSQMALQQKTEELERANDFKCQLVSLVSHELRNPLFILSEGLKRMAEGGYGNVTQKQQAFLNTALQNVLRLSHMTTDLLDMSKIEAGKMILRRSRVNLVQLAERLCQSFEFQTEKRDLELLFESSSEQIDLYIDGDKIEHVLTNLLSNAFKFTPSGTIQVILKDLQSYVLLRVSDTGQGIDKEKLPHIFEEFEQAENLVHRGSQGVGLGLAICKSIVDMHEGHIEAVSQLGHGSTFDVILPRVAGLDVFSEELDRQLQKHAQKKCEFSVLTFSFDCADRNHLPLPMSVFETEIKRDLRGRRDLLFIHENLLYALLPEIGQKEAFQVLVRIKDHLEGLLDRLNLIQSTELSCRIGVFPENASKPSSLLDIGEQVL